jgi:hypothetical protein
MKGLVAVLGALVIVAAGFGVYRLTGGDEDRARAETAAKELTRFCRGQCEVVGVEPLDGDRWLFQIRDAGGGRHCMAADLNEFRVNTRDSIYVGGTVDGVADEPCGPEWWDLRDAAPRLEQSAWGRARHIRFVHCAGEGGSPGRSLYFPRFKCRYHSPQEDGTVSVSTTGVDTFEVKPSK